MNEVQVNSQGNVQSVDFTSQEPMQPQRSSQTEMMVTRQAQEVQVAMLAAKKFPRDQVVAYNNILRACQRRKLAENSMYEFQEETKRLPVHPLDWQKPLLRTGATLILDLWSWNKEREPVRLWRMRGILKPIPDRQNYSVYLILDIPKKGDYPLTDPRDIYEAVANQAARRVRACILGIIPSDVVEAAVDRCNKTLREGYEEPLVDRVRKMAEVFEKEFSVNISMIEKYLGCKSDAFSENDFVRLKKVYRALRDGMAKR